MKRINLILSAFLIVVTVLLVRTTGVEAATAAKCAWKTVQGANPGSFDTLDGVNATSTNNVWAVGNDTNSSKQQQALIERWNGTAWSQVASPQIGTYSFLNAVSADAANDAWAVGYSLDASLLESTLIEHWNGTAWSAVASSSPSTSLNLLNGVVALAPNNVWVVGFFDIGAAASQTLIEHWNGTKWSVVTSPNPGSNGNELNGVAATSAKNIWAVGEFYTSTASQTLVEHWNGTQWIEVRSPPAAPNSGGSRAELDGIAAVSGNDLWAVGFNNLGANNVSMIEQWNGTRWSLVTHPNPGTAENRLLAITVAPGASKLWAVGDSLNTSGTGNVLIETHC